MLDEVIIIILLSDPQYSIVPITNTISHDDPHFQELSFHLKDKHVQVNLTPNEGVLIHKRTPVWKVKRVNNKVQFIEQRNASITKYFLNI